MTTPNLTAQADVALDHMAGTLAGRAKVLAVACGGYAVTDSDTYARAPDPWARGGAQSSTICPESRASACGTVAPSVGPEAVYAVLGIDPGPTQSGWCVYLPDTHRVLSCGVAPNAQMLERLQTVSYSRVAMEMIASYGMPVGREVFETCVWIGRFMQALALPESVDLVYRKDVKMHLCGTNKAKDGNVRQAILDLFPRTGGGATPQVGTKGQPGPLYGVSTHAWPALGVAITSNARSGRQPQERKA